MRVLVDTCVLAEVRRPDCDPMVLTAFQSIADADLFLSVITIGDIVKGIELLTASKKRSALEAWLQGLADLYRDQILPIDHETTQIWGEITARAQLQGVQLPVSDGLIAATALRHGLHMMTRNTRHFAATGALINDPWRNTPS